MLIVITNNEFIPDEAGLISTYLSAGVDYIHLRKNGTDKPKLINLIQQIPERFRNKISVHHNKELAEEYNLGGVHFSYNDFISLKSIDLEKFRVSVSCHNFDEIETVYKKSDYCFLSPVFDSISKEDYSGKFNSPDQLKDLMNYRNKTVALGGVNINNIQLINDLGFISAAVLGSAWQNSFDNKMISEFKKFV